MEEADVEDVLDNEMRSLSLNHLDHDSEGSIPNDEDDEDQSSEGKRVYSSHTACFVTQSMSK